MAAKQPAGSRRRALSFVPGFLEPNRGSNESSKACRRYEGATFQSKGGFQREPVRVVQPRAVILEEDGLGAANAIGLH